MSVRKHGPGESNQLRVFSRVRIQPAMQSASYEGGTSNYHFLADEYLRNQDLTLTLFNKLRACPELTITGTSLESPVAAALHPASINTGQTFFFANYEGLGSTAAHLRGNVRHCRLGGDFSSN